MKGMDVRVAGKMNNGSKPVFKMSKENLLVFKHARHGGSPSAAIG